MDRRAFIRLGAGGAGAVAFGGLASCSPPARPPESLFGHGVASGLHSESEVVLWTRVEPTLAAGAGEVEWAVSRSADMADVVANGVAAVTAETDHTVKVLVGGLPSDSSLWYRFSIGDANSPVGRARTLPSATDAPERLSLAFASCQSYGNGFYAAWRDVAERDLDAVVFLGDYIYEVGAIQLLGVVRPEPLAEAVTLEDYRAKYRLYRTDPDLQAAHAAHPWLVVWDDHELFNDWDRTSVVSAPARFAAATRAWFEYQPVWPSEGLRIHRSLRWGRLAEVMLLDTRQYRDTKGPALFGAGFLDGEYLRSDRTILGSDQRNWLLERLSLAQQDGIRWKLIGNQVLFGPQRILDLDTPELRSMWPGLPDHAGLYLGMDTWDGFPLEREVLLDHLRQGDIGGTTFLTGDIHSFWAGPVRADIDDDSSPVVAHDFAGGSISSPPGGLAAALVASGSTLSPSWDFVDGSRNGYGIIDCTPTAATVRFVGLDARELDAVPAQFASFDLIP